MPTQDNSTNNRYSNTLPHGTGISLKPQHYQEILEDKPKIPWLEIHPENYMGMGGPPHFYLEKIRSQYPLSMHGVGMSLGSADGIDTNHLDKLKALVDRYQPEQVSEHLSWSHWNEHYMNDLLPLPYTEDSLQCVANNIDRVQVALGRNILIENPSTYIAFDKQDYSETDFFSALVKKTGCGLLLDINNVFVSAYNNSFDAYEYIDQYPRQEVNEIHLAGHSLKTLTNEKKIRIDDHGSPVGEEVWELYNYFQTLEKRLFSTLIEWDTDTPELCVLLQEARSADEIMQSSLDSATEEKARGASQ